MAQGWFLRVHVRQSIDQSLASDPKLGAASAFYYNYGHLGGPTYGSPWEYINSGTDPTLFPLINGTGGAFHAYIVFNFHSTTNWHYDPSTTPPSGNFDLYSVMLHEITHFLGFASLIYPDGSGSYQGAFGGAYYSIYDSHLHVGTDPLVTSNGYYNMDFDDSYAPNVTQGNCTNITFNGSWGGGNLPIYASNDGTYQNGSTLSHLDGICYNNLAGVGFPYFVMHPSLAPTNFNRIPTPEEVTVMCDLGYQLTGFYGDGSLPFHITTLDTDYQCGNRLAGVDDPCPNDPPITMSACDNPITINFSDLTANDENTAPGNIVIDPDCLEVMAGGNTATAITIVESPPGTPVGFTYAPEETGLNIISYIPEDANGNQGNPTYVYIYVTPCPGLNCTFDIDDCNLICNPDIFSVPCPQANGGMACANFEGWGEAAQSPDYWENFGEPEQGAFGIYPGRKSDGDVRCEIPYALMNLTAGQNYLISYLRRSSDTLTLPDGTVYPDPGQVASAQIVATFTSDIDFAGGSTSPGYLISDLPYEPTDQFLYSDNAFTDFLWHQKVGCFTANDDYDALYVYATPVDVDDQAYLFVDHLDIIEDNFPEGDTIIVDCDGNGSQQIIGEQLCDQMLNLEYAWASSTDMINWTPMSETEPQITVGPLSETTHFLLTRSFNTTGSSYAVDLDPACMGDSAIYTIMLGADTTQCCIEAQFGSYDIDDEYIIAATATWTPTSNPINPSGAPLRINHDLVIPGGVNITFQAMEIHFGPRGRIVVRPDGVLTLTKDPAGGNPTILKGLPECDAMWQGIRVMGPGYQSIPTPGNYASLYSQSGTRMLDDISHQRGDDPNFDAYYRLLKNMKAAGQPIHQITSAQEEELLEIAESKTATAYKAQALLYIAKGREFPVQLPDLDILGLSGGGFTTTFKAEMPLVNLVPNPANNTVSISTRFGDADQQLAFVLYDINGKPVKTLPLSGNANQNLPLDDFAEGMYYYVVKGNDKVWHKDKLLIIR